MRNKLTVNDLRIIRKRASLCCFFRRGFLTLKQFWLKLPETLLMFSKYFNCFSIKRERHNSIALLLTAPHPKNRNFPEKFNQICSKSARCVNRKLLTKDEKQWIFSSFVKPRLSASNYSWGLQRITAATSLFFFCFRSSSMNIFIGKLINNWLGFNHCARAINNRLLRLWKYVSFDE